MGVHRDSSNRKTSLLETHGAQPGGRLMIFGRPTLNWAGAPSPEEYYSKIYGVDEVHSLDVSDYEGATYVHDLNTPDLPAEMHGRYRAVSMGGTVQLVLNVGTVLRKSIELLETGGLVFCQAPSNNRQHNSYYQLCPMLKFDFYEANGLEFETSVATLEPPGSTFRRYVAAYPGELECLNFVPARVSHTLVAKKVATSTSDRIPINSIYRFKHSGERVRWRFRAVLPYDVAEGRRVSAPVRRIPIEPARLRRVEHGYAFPFTDNGVSPSVPARPFRSKVAVLEDGRLLDWIVADKTMVEERNGSFCHFGAFVFFTSSDGSDPRSNGRVYEIVIPKSFTGLAPYEQDAVYRFPKTGERL